MTPKPEVLLELGAQFSPSGSCQSWRDRVRLTDRRGEVSSSTRRPRRTAPPPHPGWHLRVKPHHHSMAVARTQEKAQHSWWDTQPDAALAWPGAAPAAALAAHLGGKAERAVAPNGARAFQWHGYCEALIKLNINF